jgi:hypothetical protein
MEFRDELDNIILLPAPRLSSTLTTEFSTRPSRKTKISASSILAYMKINFGHDFCTIYTTSVIIQRQCLKNSNKIAILNGEVRGCSSRLGDCNWSGQQISFALDFWMARDEGRLKYIGRPGRKADFSSNLSPIKGGDPPIRHADSVSTRRSYAPR